MFLVSYQKGSASSGVEPLTNWCAAGILFKWEIATSRIIQMTSYKFRLFPMILLSIICQANKMTAWGDH